MWPHTRTATCSVPVQQLKDKATLLRHSLGCWNAGINAEWLDTAREWAQRGGGSDRKEKRRAEWLDWGKWGKNGVMELDRLRYRKGTYCRRRRNCFEAELRRGFNGHIDFLTLKGIVHMKKNILSSFNNSHVVPKLYDWLWRTRLYFCCARTIRWMKTKAFKLKKGHKSNIEYHTSGPCDWYFKSS